MRFPWLSVRDAYRFRAARDDVAVGMAAPPKATGARWGYAEREFVWKKMRTRTRFPWSTRSAETIGRRCYTGTSFDETETSSDRPQCGIGISSKQGKHAFRPAMRIFEYLPRSRNIQAVDRGADSLA